MNLRDFFPKFGQNKPLITVFFISKKMSSVCNSVEVPFLGPKKDEMVPKRKMSYLDNCWLYELD